MLQYMTLFQAYPGFVVTREHVSLVYAENIEGTLWAVFFKFFHTDTPANTKGMYEYEAMQIVNMYYQGSGAGLTK